MKNLYIEITDACNLRCSFCPSKARRDFMSTSLFEKCVAGATEIGAENVYFHVLGEPTLHPGFSLFVKHLESTPLKLTLVTNGTTIARTGRAILESPAVRQVNFSTHAFAELPPDDARGHLQDVFDFCKMALAMRPDLYINLRLWNIGDSGSGSWNSYMLGRIRETFGVEVNPGNFCSRHKSFPIEGRLYLHEDSRFEWPGAPAASTIAGKSPSETSTNRASPKFSTRPPPATYAKGSKSTNCATPSARAAATAGDSSRRPISAA